MKMSKVIDPKFHKAIDDITSQKIPVVLAYKLADLLEKIQAEKVKYESVRSALLIRHGDKDEEGKLKINESKTEYLLKDKEAFEKEYNELLNIDIELPIFKLSEFSDSIKIDPKAMLQIKELLTP